ncbi:MAG: hypothetical protein IPG67_05185 [Acidobacteria bacterium]|nr:hypothetical protein [Acidobacteriota bacterium]
MDCIFVDLKLLVQAGGDLAIDAVRLCFVCGSITTIFVLLPLDEKEAKAAYGEAHRFDRRSTATYLRIVLPKMTAGRQIPQYLSVQEILNNHCQRN